MRLFEDSWKRIDRSVMHAKSFVEEFNRLFPSGGYSVAFKQESPGTVVASVVFAVEPHILENSLALELGEFFYQLRGALDAAIWKAVTICEGSEPLDTAPGANRLDFPICGEGKFEASAIHKFKFPEKLKAWLRTIQPDSAEKPQDDPDFGLNVTLETIHNIARKDRHRRLHVAAAVPRSIDYAVEGVPADLRVVSAESIASDFLKGDYQFMRFGLESPSGLPVTQAKLATGVTIDVVLEGIPLWPHESFAGELRRCGMATEYVVQEFEEVFAGWPSGAT
ncbi:MAG: hypothetical protein WCB58_17455 [Acidobacteriaceae bacterium]